MHQTIYMYIINKHTCMLGKKKRKKNFIQNKNSIVKKKERIQFSKFKIVNYY